MEAGLIKKCSEVSNAPQSPKPPSPKKKKSYRKRVESEWLHEQILKLIQEIETRRSLWDAGCAEYKLPKEALWQEVADATQMPLNECKGKWSNLRTTFNSNHEKYRKKKSGQASNESISISWKYFQQMFFLESNKVRQSTQSTSSLELNSAVDDTTFLKNFGQQNTPPPPTSTSNVGKRLKRQFDTPLASSSNTSRNSYLKLMAVEALQSMQHKKKNANTALCDYMAEELENLGPEAGAYARSRIRRAFNDIIDQVALMEELPQHVRVEQYYGDGDSNELLFIPRQPKETFSNEFSEEKFSL